VIEYPFFDHYLKGGPAHTLPEAFIFDSGRNEWHEFASWPPAEVEPFTIRLGSNRSMTIAEGHDALDTAAVTTNFEEFTSDPNLPVPFTEEVTTGMPKPYMTADQRFASRRPDVLTFKTEVLAEEVTLTGDLVANLLVSITGTDADWIVKIIDVYPNDAEDLAGTGAKMGGYQQMVRSEVIRGRFRNSNEQPEPFVPGQTTQVLLELQDVMHTFKKGHRIMVQIQSTWFPIVDRNPQTYVDNIFEATEADFVKHQHRVFVEENGSFITVGRMFLPEQTPPPAVSDDADMPEIEER
jgi:putative CocE/NonD family hydrolase